MEEHEEEVDFEVEVDAEPLQTELEPLPEEELSEAAGEQEGDAEQDEAQPAAKARRRGRRRRRKQRFGNKDKNERSEQTNATRVERPATTSVRVSEIAEGVDIAALRSKFAEYGRVYQVVRNGRSASVDYYEKDSAVAAVRALDGKEMFGVRRIAVSVSTDSANGKPTLQVSGGSYNSLRDGSRDSGRDGDGRVQNGARYDRGPRVRPQSRSRSRSRQRRRSPSRSPTGNGRIRDRPFRSRSRDRRELNHHYGRRPQVRSRSRSPRRSHYGPSSYVRTERRDDRPGMLRGSGYGDRRLEPAERGRALSTRPRSDFHQFGSGSLSSTTAARRSVSPRRGNAYGGRR